MTSILIAIGTGALAGWIASLIMGTKGGLLRNIILGIVGGFVGGYVFGLLGISIAGYFGTVVTAVAGSCLVVFVANLLFK